MTAFTALKARLRFELSAARVSTRLALAGRRTPGRGAPVIAGFFSDARGVAQSARLAADAFESNGLGIVRHDTTAILNGRRPPPPPGEGPIILHANPHEAAILLDAWPTETWAHRFRVGYWVWELAKPRPDWARAAPWFDEIWTPSQFSAEALLQLPHRAPVRVMRHPVPALSIAPNRERFGLQDGVVYAFTAFDLRSSAARKNPMAAVSAYLEATPEPRADRGLVIKVLGDEADHAAMQRLRSLAADRVDVKLLTGSLPSEDMLQLIASIDIVISLHRSEGFGLTLAEAMRLGKPVAATAWSGNMEFMSETSAALVPATLVPVEDPSGAYPAGSAWAAPDQTVAARALQHLMDDAKAREDLGKRAQAHAADKLDGAYTLATLSETFRASTNWPD